MSCLPLTLSVLVVYAVCHAILCFVSFAFKQRGLDVARLARSERGHSSLGIDHPSQLSEGFLFVSCSCSVVVVFILTYSEVNLEKQVNNRIRGSESRRRRCFFWLCLYLLKTIFNILYVYLYSLFSSYSLLSF